MALTQEFFVTVLFYEDETGPPMHIEFVRFRGSDPVGISEHYKRQLEDLKSKMGERYKYMQVSPPTECAAWKMAYTASSNERRRTDAEL